MSLTVVDRSRGNLIIIIAGGSAGAAVGVVIVVIVIVILLKRPKKDGYVKLKEVKGGGTYNIITQQEYNQGMLATTLPMVHELWITKQQSWKLQQ